MGTISLTAAQALTLAYSGDVTLRNLTDVLRHRLREVRLASDFAWDLRPLDDETVHGWPSGPMSRGWRKFDIDYSDIELLRRYRNPIVRVYFRDLVCNAEDTKLVLKCIRQLFLDAMVKYRTHLRRRIVLLTADPQDPNSFNHKSLQVLIHEGLCDVGSMFLLNPENDFLVLSATTGLRTRLPKKDVFYTLDDKSWVRQAFQEHKIRVEHAQDKPLHENRFGEDTGASQARSRIYLPLTTQTDNTADTRRWPISGVFRLLRTNNQAEGQIKWPRYFTWLDAYFVDFVGEVMHVVLQGYLSSWWAHSLVEKIVHGIKSGVDGSLEQIRIIRLLLFPSGELIGKNLLTSEWVQNSFTRSRADKLLQNAEFFLLDASEQVEIVTDGTLVGSSANKNRKLRIIERLFADVIQQAVNLSPRIAFVNNAPEQPLFNNLKDAGAKQLPTVYGDDGLVLSVFRNLIENSVKYAKPGTRANIAISFDVSDDFLWVVFQDDGIGVPISEEKSLFTQGFRGREARDRTLRGRGIGLAYCKKIMEMMGGDLEFRRNDRGACFVVKLKRIESTHAKRAEYE